MREKLLNFIVCPHCKSELLLNIEKKDNDHIMEGSLHCANCLSNYPIIEGIPILLEENLIDEKNKITAERFGKEWEQFDFIDIERYTQQFLDWIEPIEKSFFRDKIVFDAGCGKGRHLIASAQFHAKEIIGVDLATGSVKSAFKNTKHLTNVHIIQGNLYHLPFKNNTFDYVYSIGVLHHTPDPKKTFTELVKIIKQKGTISAWVYGKEGNWWIIYILNPIRNMVTSKLPLFILKWISFILTIILQGVLKLIYKPINEINILKPFRNLLFYNEYLYYISKFPFRENYSIVFDHLLPEIAFYISKDEFISWFQDTQLEQIIITQKTNNSWRGKGKKP